MALHSPALLCLELSAQVFLDGHYDGVSAAEL